MISIIIPTLWKSEKIIESIKQFIESDIKNSELIIIDNLGKENYLIENDNIIFLKQENNIGVNKAWNIGVEQSKNDLICLLNDDITFNFKTLKNNLENIKEITNTSFIGFDANTNFSDNLNLDDDIFELIESPCRTLGFGCLMIFNKKNYIKIDERLKIFFGDDLLYYFNKNLNNRTIYNIKNLKSTGELSKTSKDYEYLLQEEVKYFDKIINEINYNNNE